MMSSTFGSNVYYFGVFTHESNTDSNVDITIYMYNIGPATATVYVDSYNGKSSFQETVAVTSMGYGLKAVPSHMRMSLQNNYETNVLTFESDNDVTCATYVIANQHSAAFMPLPTSSASDLYYIITYCTGVGEFYCFVTVFSTISISVDVEFTMPDRSVTLFDGTLNGRTCFSAKETVTQNIPVGELHFITASSNVASMKVVSLNGPIHVMAASNPGGILTHGTEEFQDEQMLPVTTWDTVFVVANGNTDILWITPSLPNTTVAVLESDGNKHTYPLGEPGVHVEIQFSTSAQIITSNKPMMVSHWVISPLGHSMHFEASIGHYGQTALFFAPLDFTCDVYIYTFTNMTSSLKVNGVVCAGSWVDIPYVGFSTTKVDNIAADTLHHIEVPSGLFSGYLDCDHTLESKRFSLPLTPSSRNLQIDCDGGPWYSSHIFNMLTTPTTTTAIPTTSATTTVTTTTTDSTTSTTDFTTSTTDCTTASIDFSSTTTDSNTTTTDPTTTIADIAATTTEFTTITTESTATTTDSATTTSDFTKTNTDSTTTTTDSTSTVDSPTTAPMTQLSGRETTTISLPITTYPATSTSTYTSTPIRTITWTVSSSQATQSPSCLCNCSYTTLNIQLSHEAATKAFEKLLSEMRINPKDTGKYRRLKSCADDSRTSSKAVGNVMGVVILSLFGLIFIGDIITIVQHLKYVLVTLVAD